jgi:hypothetical protein
MERSSTHINKAKLQNNLCNKLKFNIIKGEIFKKGELKHSMHCMPIFIYKWEKCSKRETHQNGNSGYF